MEDFEHKNVSVPIKVPHEVAESLHRIIEKEREKIKKTLTERLFADPEEADHAQG